jgi:hypothetical protein
MVKDLTGGFNYRVIPLQEAGFWRAHARAGWAWTSYTLRDLSVSGRPLDEPLQRGGRFPTIYPSTAWWPTTGYAGLSFEAFTPPRYWLMKRLGVGMRLDLTGSLYRLQIGGECDCRVTARRGDAAFHVLLGW